MTCVIQITGGKDVGKTVVAERLIKRLKADGKTVLAVKISHHDPEPPTKDTHRLRKAGADKVLFYNGQIYVLYTTAVKCEDLQADYIIVEGLRDAKLGYKIHIGPDPPPDADLVLNSAEAEPEVACVRQDPCTLLEAISKYKPHPTKL